MNGMQLIMQEGWTDDERRHIIGQLMQLLAGKVREATQGDHASIPTEKAEHLLDGICFTLTAFLDAQHLPPRALLDAPLSRLYMQGQEALKTRAARAQAQYRLLMTRPLPFPNRALSDSLRELAVFFRRYDMALAPQEVPCVLDYPLSRPVDETLHGICYMEAYLRQLQLEDDFLRLFDVRLLSRLLYAVCPDPVGQLLNLYDCAAVQALGCALSGAAAPTLALSPAAQEALLCKLSPLSYAQLTVLLDAAVQALSSQLSLGEAQTLLLRHTAASLQPRLHAALRHGSLGQVFFAL